MTESQIDTATRSPSILCFRRGVFVTLDRDRRVVTGDLIVADGRIAEFLTDGTAPPPGARIIDLEGRTVLPGFIQSHIHGCQTLFRGAADDLLLLDWLKTRIWPLEAAHDPASLAASLELTALELLKGGTTAALTMETVHHTEHAFAALERTPLRAVVGKCLMDRGAEVPNGLLQPTARALDEAVALAKRHPARNSKSRLRACLAPRFALSCSEGLMRDVAAVAKELGLVVHTHGAEQREEVAIVERETGKRNLDYLLHVGFDSGCLRLAHAVHLDPSEERRLVESRTHVLHCPSSNLKLGSGIAPIQRYLDLGVRVSLGADGAPCNNNLDGLREARLAALLQKPLFGPQALPAHRALELLTIEGAAALGMDDEIGSLEIGKWADLVEIDLSGAHLEPCGDTYSRVIYAAERSDIRRVFVAGETVVERGRATYCDEDRVVAVAREQALRLFTRAGIAR